MKNKILLFLLIPIFCLNASTSLELKGSKPILLDSKNIPHHVAIIMDGNRRWAKLNDLSLKEGYLKGAETLGDIIKSSIDLGIKVLTVYAFSTENWARQQEEIDTIIDVFEHCLVYQKQTLQDEGVRLNVIGDLTRFPKKVMDTFYETKKATASGKKLDLILAINYGGRDEIKRAFIKLIDDLENKQIKKEDITEDIIATYLDTKDYKDPDLIIRTAKENRLSNFLLWQASYSEIYISDVFWPEFTYENFLKALDDFQKRKRRGGK